MFYLIDCIYVLAQQAHLRILRQDYDRTLTNFNQIEQNVRSICKYQECLKK